MKASDIMTRDVITLEETRNVGEALEVLSELQIRHLPVVSRGSQLVGMISDRDLRALGTTLVRDIESIDRLNAEFEQPVSAFMQSGVTTVEPDTEVTDIVDLMLEERIGALPVVDPSREELVGMVSYVDVLRAARDKLD